ncbi:chemotaxis protein CheW [Treponema sp.]|uniref:chemotaxis protein CheW n=1 Tax=Treponema sp. TaxID=166 RepID=UPI00298E86A6|nr:chemotaxis protein CheW [Treponema sp.]MCR5612413.1 chemotaxis protein CheW [Treponema sp.]
MAEEILSLIKSSSYTKTETQQTEKKATWLIFTIGNSSDGKNMYAVPAECVKEILRDATVFPIPFVPPYVNGVLNRYGDPYVVIDSAVLEGKEAQKSFLFIVLNDESHTCLRITDVKDFFTATEKDVVHFSESELSDFYDGTLSIDGQEVFVLKIQAIIEKVGKEIAAA